jgi:DNA (cytosine-5)-methyltransferase 1
MKEEYASKEATGGVNPKFENVIWGLRPKIVACRQLRFIDLFAGLGGIRLGFEQACSESNFKAKCVFSSEIKPYAIEAYKSNFKEENVDGDITKIDATTIPDFDYLLAGFPCQPFSSAGKRLGFLDERGSLFLDILRILKTKKPAGFLLENVDGLVSHDDGKTFKKILKMLEAEGYKVSWKILNAKDFGVPQNRKRVYIVGHKKKIVDLSSFSTSHSVVGDILESVDSPQQVEFAKTLLSRYSPDDLYGKSIKDKRGGKDNIHSWDLECKGSVSDEQKSLMNELLKQRRMKKWAIAKGIEWMDGMPLTAKEISTFFPHNELLSMLNDLSTKGYLKFEHPKGIVVKDGVRIRKYDTTKEKGYNIVAGKLSFPITKILGLAEIAPTIVATEVGKIAVLDNKKLRNLTVREGLRLSGYPENYSLDMVKYSDAFDLLGNTVMPPVIKEVILRILKNER